MKLRTLAMLVAGIALLSLSAFATDVSANLSVSANVVNACTVSAGSLDFGDYDPLSGSDVDDSGSFDVRCTNGGQATIKLGEGAHPSAGSAPAAPLRNMDNSGNALSYQLYTDSGRTTVWENATGVSYTGDGTTDTQTVYGRIVAGQNAVAGSFSDTVVITVTY